MADKILPVFFGPGVNMDEVVGYAEIVDNTLTFTVKGEQLTRRLPSLVSVDEIRGLFLGLRYTLPNTKTEVEKESDADRFAAMPPLLRSEVAEALSELPPIPDRNVYDEYS